MISEEDEAGSAGAAEFCKTVELVTACVAEACNRVVTPMVYDDKTWYRNQSRIKMRVLWGEIMSVVMKSEGRCY